MQQTTRKGKAMTNKNTLFTVDVGWIKTVVDVKYKHLSDTQRQAIVETVLERDDQIFQAINAVIELLGNEWVDRQNAGLDS